MSDEQSKTLKNVILIMWCVIIYDHCNSNNTNGFKVCLFKHLIFIISNLKSVILKFVFRKNKLRLPYNYNN